MNFRTDNIQNLDKNTILSKVSEEEIFRRYIDDYFSIGTPFISPLRQEDNPSFSVYYNPQGSLRYKDFNGTQGTCFDFVMNKFGITFIEALHRINDDFKLNLNYLGYDNNNTNTNSSPIISIDNRTISKKQNKLLQVTLRKFQTGDYGYWSEFGIDRELLERFNIRAVEEVFINRRRHWRSTGSNPIYGYYFPDTHHIKCYRPLEPDKKFKWIGNVTGEDIQGYEQLPGYGDLLIITKSMKDVMCLASIGLVSVAPQGEDHYFNESIIKQLKYRFRDLVVWFDSDEPGIKGSIKLTQMYDLDYVNIPKGLPKDPSDYYKEFGRDKLIEFCKQKELL